MITSAKIKLLQSVLEGDGGSVVQNDRIDVSRIRCQVLRGNVENPLLCRWIKPKGSVGIICVNDILHVGRHRSCSNLRQLKAGDNSRRTDRVPIRIADAELRRNRLALLEHAGTIRMDWLQNLAPYIATARRSCSRVLHELRQRCRRAAEKICISRVSSDNGMRTYGQR